MTPPLLSHLDPVPLPPGHTRPLGSQRAAALFPRSQAWVSNAAARPPPQLPSRATSNPRSTKAQAHGRQDESGGRARPSPTSRHCPRFHKCRPGAAPLSPTGPRGLQGLRGELCRRQGPRRTVPAEKHAPATDLATRGRLAHTCRQHRAPQPMNSGMKGLVHIRMP